MMFEERRVLTMKYTMTKETLEKSMRKFLKNFKNDLWEAYEDEDEDITDEKSLNRAIDELTSEKVLNYINNNMKFQPILEFKLFGKNIMDEVIEGERVIGHNIQYVDKLYYKPMCFLGYINNQSGLYGELYSEQDDCVFLSVDGEWIYAKRSTFYEWNTEDENDYYNIQYFKRTKKKCYSLCCLEEFLSEGLNETINGY